MIEAVIDSKRRETAFAQMRQVAESSYRIDLSAVEERHWVVVPVESASHFNAEDAARIAEACAAIGCEECHAVATEHLVPSMMCYDFKTTQSDLLEFSRECGNFNFLMFPNSMEFAILCTVKNYYLVAGSPQFVAKAVGGNVEAARSEFIEFANDEFWEPSRREFMLRIAQDYSACGE